MALPFPYTLISAQPVAGDGTCGSSGATTAGLSGGLDFGEVPFHFVKTFGVDFQGLTEAWSSLHLCEGIVRAKARVCRLCTELEVWFGRCKIIWIERVCRHGRSKVKESFWEIGIFAPSAILLSRLARCEHTSDIKLHQIRNTTRHQGRCQIWVIGSCNVGIWVCRRARRDFVM